ncbi:MAG: hypothetical protein HWN81_01640 [Candidatus Lokiarchaeota archaeon]|nr:hypothetical protein [Candidatus Lokiarchaeota archaeon]
MKSQKIHKIRKRKGTLILTLLLIGLFPTFLLNFSSIEYSKENSNEDIDGINGISPELSVFGEHPWWDSNWPYRTLVNITNQAGVDLENYGVSVVLPYRDDDYQGKVNDSLKDIRVIEYINNEPIEREYYIFKDFDGDLGDDSAVKATIYFNTNLTASSSPQTDTYIYFGNMQVQSTAVDYGLGSIKNGDFEYVPIDDDPTGNPSVSPHYYNPVGWNWSDDIPDDIAPRPPDVGEDSQTEDQATEWWQNCLIATAVGDTQVRGTYTYKWGSNQTSITDSTGPDNQYGGVLYTNPFVVPIVDDGSGKIYLRLWQNVRIWGFDGSSSKAYNDGYFVRVINASSDLFGDPDDHQQLGQYLGYFKGITHNNKGGYSLQNYTLGTVTGTFDTDLGELTGFVSFDLSNYMGQNISLELGMYGDENTVGNYDTGFVQVDDVEFTYNDDLTIVLNDPQIQQSDITVITRDIDGRIISNAEVSLVQDGSLMKKQITDESGTTIFTGLNFGIYNFTVNYTFSPSYEDEVFNSYLENFGTAKWNLYNVSELDHTFELYLDVWTIDFEIVDWDEDLLNDGYVKVFDDNGGTLLKQLSLVNGTARFRWNNASFYYYEVYFDNTKYNVNEFLLNSSYIYRSNYVQNEKFYDHLLPVSTYDQEAGNYYRVYERIYTNGSMSDFTHKKLINFNITLETMDDRIDNMTIYYIDKNNQTVGNVIYQNNSMSGTEFFKSIDIGTVDNDKLKGENYEAYGILIDVKGYRIGAHNGLIKINTTELTNVYNKTALSKMHIRVIDDAYSYDPVPYVSVRIWNGSSLITTLTTYDDGWASHYEATYKPFIFLIGYRYNITLRRIGVLADFYVNYTDPYQWGPLTDVNIYNYTLYQNSTVILDFQEAAAPPALETQIELLADISQAVWNIGDLHVTINVSYSTDGINWIQVLDEGTFTCYVEDWITGEIVLIEDLTPNYDGPNLQNYSFTINSSRLSAGYNFKKYWFIIDGEIPGYEPPEPYYQQVQVNASSTSINLYDYETRLIVSDLKKEFGELINITVRYYGLPDNPLEDPIITFKWINQPTKYFVEDPVHNGYYYCEIDTSPAINVGTYPITITASKENYTSQTIFSSLQVLERPTTLNGESDLVYINSKVWVQDPNPFEFIYQDIISEENIGNLTTASYTWEELYSNGSRIPGVSGTGFLVQNGDNTHTLDFHTELKSIGFYYLYVTLHKQNYKAKSALINLEIMSRIFNYTFPTEKIVEGILTLRNGDPLDLDIILHDLTRDIPLQNATISMVYQNNNYTFSEGVNGSYSVNVIDYTRLTEDETSTTSTTQIIISKVNFTSQIIATTIFLQNRFFNISITEPFRNNLIRIISGDRLSFDITLIDSYDGSPITDGTINIFIGGGLYEDISIVNNGDGTYAITFLSYPEAFTSSKTLSGEITFQKTNFKKEIVSITIEIKMAEIFPGMPTFYFILITLSIIGVLGSVVAYRVIQQARIPNHVKKIRKVKGLIKSKKKIEELISIPSKEQMIAKLFGNDWKQIGLSIEKSLGIEESKKKLAIKDKITEQRGDIE